MTACYRCEPGPRNVGHLCQGCLREIAHAVNRDPVDEGPAVQRQPYDVPMFPLGTNPHHPDLHAFRVRDMEDK